MQRLTDDQLEQIEAMLAAGGRSNGEIARDVGVSRSVVNYYRENLGRLRSRRLARQSNMPRMVEAANWFVIQEKLRGKHGDVDFNPPQPGQPTEVAPGTPDKVAVFAARLERGEPIFDPADKIPQNCPD